MHVRPLDVTRIGLVAVRHIYRIEVVALCKIELYLESKDCESARWGLAYRIAQKELSVVSYGVFSCLELL